jgi:hypothetical protein
MSYTSNKNASNILQGVINSLTNTPIAGLNSMSNIGITTTNGYTTTTNGYTTANGNGYTAINTTGAFNMSPTFKIEMYKSENGGFILNLITMNPNTFQDMYKLFILNDIQNMGRDIQNILAAEILKS